VDPEHIKRASEDDRFAVQFARIESHYFVNGGFFKEEEQLLNDADKIANIPITIIQGRYDVVCPAYSAWDLSKRCRHAELHWVDDAGHSAKEPGTIHELIKATDKYKDLPSY